MFLISPARSAVSMPCAFAPSPALCVVWKVRPPAHGRSGRKEGNSSSGPSARCGDPVSVTCFSLPPLVQKKKKKKTMRSHREEVEGISGVIYMPAALQSRARP